MSWSKWFRKLGVGLLLSILTALIAALTGLQGEAKAPWWLLLALPGILVGLLALQNLVKHLGKT